MERLPYIELRVTEIRTETRDTKSLVLEQVTGAPMRYLAGQFLTLVFPTKTRESRRSYSISSAPSLGEPLTITIKRLDNGEFSRYLLDYCEVGSRLYTIGPSGFFVLPDSTTHPGNFVFYAAGSGITPVLPLIKTLLVKVPGATVRLVYSNHHLSDAIFYSVIMDLQDRFPYRFSVEWLFSDAKQLLKARLTKHLVEQHVNGGLGLDKRKTLFYLCGPYAYMQMITITLLREGVRPDQVRKEIFSTVKPEKKMIPPDLERRKVTIEHRDGRIDLLVQYPETILATALRQGVLLPYSCEAGRCGTCAATCRSGTVWMSRNEVLMDKEIAEGRVLTCTGYPVNGDVVLYYP